MQSSPLKRKRGVEPEAAPEQSKPGFFRKVLRVFGIGKKKDKNNGASKGSKRSKKPQIVDSFVETTDLQVLDKPATEITTPTVRRKGGEAWDMSATQFTVVPSPPKKQKVLLSPGSEAASAVASMNLASPAVATSGPRTTRAKTTIENAREEWEGSADYEDTEGESFETIAARVAGQNFVDYFASKKWSDRRGAVDETRERLPALVTSNTKEEVFNFCCMVARKCCKDKIAPVFFSGLDLLKAVIEQFAEAVEYTAVCSHLSDLLGPILKKMSNKNARMQREAAKALLSVAKSKNLNGVSLLSPMLISESFPLRPRLNILRILIPMFKFEKGSKLAIGTVMAVAVPALQIADDKTRKAAVAVVTEAYAAGGKRVQKHLKDVKPALLRILHRKFAEVDSIKAGKHVGGISGSALKPLRVGSAASTRSAGTITSTASTDASTAVGGEVPPEGADLSHRTPQADDSSIREDDTYFRDSQQPPLKRLDLKPLGSSTTTGTGSSSLPPRRPLATQPSNSSLPALGKQSSMGAPVTGRSAHSTARSTGSESIFNLSAQDGAPASQGVQLLVNYFDNNDEAMMDDILNNII